MAIELEVNTLLQNMPNDESIPRYKHPIGHNRRTGNVSYSGALNSNMPDFEDMLQYEAALAEGCEVIVTRDVNRHFPTDIIPILAPIAFLDKFAANF